MRALKLGAVVVTVVALASCASLQRARDSGNVERFSTLINSGQAERLAELSVEPFLLDQEIVLLPRDVETFWRGVVSAGFRVEEPELERGVAATPDSYGEFADTMEVRTFFAKYVRPGTRLLTLKTADGRRMLLLVRQRFCAREIRGFKGPF